MKKNLIIVLMMAIIMPIFFLSPLGYPSQSKKALPFPLEEADSVIEDGSALNPGGVEVYTALMNGRGGTE